MYGYGGKILHIDLTARKTWVETKPEEWYKMTNCGYDAPEDPSVKAILEQNVKGEQCAIDVYKGLIDATREKDLVTQNMVREILEDEVEHKEDLQAILEDLGAMKSSH